MTKLAQHLKEIIKWATPKAIRDAVEEYRSFRRRLDVHERKLRNVFYLSLRAQYPSLASPVQFADGINQHGFKCYSQNNEDGILLYLFSIIGVANRRFVEIGIQDGRQCNTANLSLNFGWSGLLLEADPQAAESARRFYRDILGAEADNLHIVTAFVTAENVNRLMVDNGFQGEIDLVSIDIDGNDYWVWQALTAITPRIVVIEYNAVFGVEPRVTIPYDSAFAVNKVDPGGIYHGASLAALAHLADQKGYVLVGCEANGVNAFFVRRDLVGDRLRVVSVQEAYFPNARLLMRGLAPEQQLARGRHLPLVTV